MRFLRRPDTLKGELQLLFLAVGTSFLVLATILLHENGQASLRRQLMSAATTAAETAAALIKDDSHRSIRTAADMNGLGFREIVEDLGSFRRANPAIYHLFTLVPTGQLGDWGVVVDMGGTAPLQDLSELHGGRLPIGAPPPHSVPPALLLHGMERPVCEILDLGDPARARAVAVAPIRARSGESVGLVVLEQSAADLIAEGRLLLYVSIALFLVGLLASVVASSAVSRWVTRPMDDLLRGVGAIAKGNLAARVETNARNELGALADAVNQMAAGLEEAHRRDAVQQELLRELHRRGSEAAAMLDLPHTLQVAAQGMLAVCGGRESIAGAAGPREGRIRHWVRFGSGAIESGTWEMAPEPLDIVLQSQARLLTRVELEVTGLGFLHASPASYALAAPLRVNDQTIGVLLAIGEREEFHDDAVSLASLFAAQVSAAVANARLFDQVRALDRSKSEFLSIASHEVRTPLTVMKSSLDLLANESSFQYSNDQRRLISFCQESVERLIRLVKDILDISKIEAGVLRVSMLPTSISALVDQCLLWIPQLPGGRGIEIDARRPARPILVLADGGRIQQVLENLVSNAIKFSSPGGRLTIELIEREQEVEVVVADQGKGIAPDDLERIFGKFTQIEDSATREQGGTGLGLAICRGIIEAHRGRLWAESEPGKGSSFHFTLARAAEVPSLAEDAEIRVTPLLSALRGAR